MPLRSNRRPFLVAASSQAPHRFGVRRSSSIATAGLALTASLAASSAGCGPSCEEVKAEAESLLASWGECKSEGAVCVVMQATEAECTGTFACPFAVRADAEEEALPELERIVDESHACDACAVAECPAPGEAYCKVDPDTREGRCTVGEAF